jgi:hypothetical protein
MAEFEPRPERVTNAELVREALEQTRELIQVEVALAKDEVKKELSLVKIIAAASGVAVLFGFAAFVVLLVTLGLVISLSALPMFIIGLILLAIAVVAAIVAYEEIPKKPMRRTQHRVRTDARLIKEHVV